MYIMHFIYPPHYLLFLPLISTDPLLFRTISLLIPYLMYSLIYLVNQLASRSWVKHCLKGPRQLPVATLAKDIFKGLKLYAHI